MMEAIWGDGRLQGLSKTSKLLPPPSFTSGNAQLKSKPLSQMDPGSLGLHSLGSVKGQEEQR